MTELFGRSEFPIRSRNGTSSVGCRNRLKRPTGGACSGRVSRWCAEKIFFRFEFDERCKVEGAEKRMHGERDNERITGVDPICIYGKQMNTSIFMENHLPSPCPSASIGQAVHGGTDARAFPSDQTLWNLFLVF
jgi:hypothetical protein